MIKLYKQDWKIPTQTRCNKTEADFKLNEILAACSSQGAFK